MRLYTEHCCTGKPSRVQPQQSLTIAKTQELTGPVHENKTRKLNLNEVKKETNQMGENIQK